MSTGSAERVIAIRDSDSDQYAASMLQSYKYVYFCDFKINPDELNVFVHFGIGVLKLYTLLVKIVKT